MSEFTDADFQTMMRGAVRVALVLGVVGAIGIAIKWGWQPALLFLIGSVISGTGVWEWRRLMTGVAAQMGMDEAPGKKPAMGFVLVVFFLRLTVVVAVLYVTLTYLQGSVIALAAGLMVGVISLTIQAIGLLRTWTV